jgi:Rrf2 family transcriptional regulator, nitric oxide-sensitive transcriptional repressor
MRLTRFTDNALRCLTYLGVVAPRRATVAEISSRMGMSEDHLLKVVRRLVALGYVRAIRGRSGGLELARPSEEINIGEVTRATEESLALVPCFNPGPCDCPIAPSCVLPGALDSALNGFFEALGRYTLADLVRPRAPLTALLRAKELPRSA